MKRLKHGVPLRNGHSQPLWIGNHQGHSPEWGRSFLHMLHCVLTEVLSNFTTYDQLACLPSVLPRAGFPSESTAGFTAQPAVGCLAALLCMEVSFCLSMRLSSQMPSKVL